MAHCIKSMKTGGLILRQKRGFPIFKYLKNQQHNLSMRLSFFRAHQASVAIPKTRSQVYDGIVVTEGEFEHQSR